jgi:hypothetical protein
MSSCTPRSFPNAEPIRCVQPSSIFESILQANTDLIPDLASLIASFLPSFDLQFKHAKYLGYFETSAKTGQGFDFFQTITRIVVPAIEQAIEQAVENAIKNANTQV